MLTLKNISKRALSLLLALMLVMPFTAGAGYAQTDRALQNATVIDNNIENQLEFLYIESPELEAPGAQNIAISWDDSIKKADSLELIYTNDAGDSFTLKESERTATSVLFSRDFSSDETGTYLITGVNYTIGEATGFFEFNDVEIAASFTVTDNIADRPEDEQIVVVAQDAGEVNSDQIESLMYDTLKSADVATDTSGSQKDIIVVLDPGHGSYEAGAIYEYKEHELVSRIAKYCRDELIKYDGVKVYLTHNGTGFKGDAATRMQARVDYASSVGADVLLSLHLNATGAGDANGAEVYYPNENYVPEMITVGKPLAEAVLAELGKLGLEERKAEPRNTINDEYPDGTKQDYYGIIRRCKLAGIPGIIVEHAFLDNTEEVENFLSSEEKLKALAKADTDGIVKYFDLAMKEEGADVAAPVLKSFGYSSANVKSTDSIKINVAVEDADSLPETVKLTLTNSTTGSDITLSDFVADSASIRDGYFTADFSEVHNPIGKYFVKEIIITDTYGNESAYNTADSTLEQKYFTVSKDLDSVEVTINNLADITISKESLTEAKAAINAARESFDQLSDAEKTELGSDVELILVKSERDLAIVEKEIAQAEKDAAIADKKAAVTEKNAAIADKKTAVTEKNAAITAKNTATAEKDRAKAALAVTKSSVGTIKASVKNVSNTAATLTYSWSKVKHADKYQVVLYRNGQKVSTVYTSTTSRSFAKYARGYSYTVKVTPYKKYDGITYYGKTGSKTLKITHGNPSLKVSKSGKYHVLKSDDRNSTGFQIYISKSKKFSKNVKKYKFSTSSKALNKKLLTTKYFYKGTNYVKVRAYTTYKGQTVYSNWSPVKKVYR